MCFCGKIARNGYFFFPPKKSLNTGTCFWKKITPEHGHGSWAAGGTSLTNPNLSTPPSQVDNMATAPWAPSIYITIMVVQDQWLVLHISMWDYIGLIVSLCDIIIKRNCTSKKKKNLESTNTNLKKKKVHKKKIYKERWNKCILPPHLMIMRFLTMHIVLCRGMPVLSWPDTHDIGYS